MRRVYFRNLPSTIAYSWVCGVEKTLIMIRKYLCTSFLVLYAIICRSQFPCNNFDSRVNLNSQPIASRWHQDGTFRSFSSECTVAGINYKLPIGCTAVALSQVLNHFDHPNYPISFAGLIHERCWNETQYSPISFSVINKNILSQPSSDVGVFTREIANALGTIFDDKWTGPVAVTQEPLYTLQFLLVELFDYQAEIKFYDDRFFDWVKFEVAHCRPVIVDAGKSVNSNIRHAFIIDDYDKVLDKYHVNWGWSHLTDGWYDETLTNEDGDSYGGNIIGAIVNISPNGNPDPCCYLGNVTTNYNNTYFNKPKDNLKLKSVTCNNIIYPQSSNDLLRNKIELHWQENNIEAHYKVDVLDTDNNVLLYSNLQPYGGHPRLSLDLPLPNSTNIEYTISEYLNNSLIGSCTHNLLTKDSTCDIRLEYYKAYCVDNGSDYVIELDFEGNNTSYDVFAEWNGTIYDSKDGITPGFLILGPIDTSQKVAIIIEDELNPQACFETSLILPNYLSTDCFPNPISNANGGSTQNPPVTCPVPSGFSAPVSGNKVTYNWNWHANAQNIIIEEVLGTIILDTHVVGNDGNNNSLVINYDPCQEFDVRAKFDCGQYFGSYTSSTHIDMTHASCDNPICPLPSNVSHTINSGNPDILNVSWNNDGNSHEICFYENGILLSCSVKPPAQTSTGINMIDCDNYDYQIRSVCGSDVSNWITNNESIQTGNNCGSLTDLYPWGASATVEITSTQIKLLDLEVYNNGNYATTSTIEIALFLKPASYSAPLTYVSSLYYNIPANSSITDDFVFNYEDNLPSELETIYTGEYNLHVLVDAQSAEPERNETNNTLTFLSHDLFYGCDDPSAQWFNYSPNSNVILCYYCNDGIKNGKEHEVDCGGGFCLNECCLNTFYLDSDGDGHGEVTQYVFGCIAPSGYVDNGIDCDDNDAAKYPGNAEICDNIDNDCDGLIDEDSVCCPESIVITDSLEIQNCTSENILTIGEVIINSGQNIEYKSQTIRLLPGFNSNKGSVFNATINPCSN